MMKKQTDKPSHITRGNVFDDLGFTPEKAASLKVKAELLHDILKRTQGFTQSQLQRILNEPQPRISELLHGKIIKVSIEKLISYAVRLGSIPQIRIRNRMTARPRKKNSRRIMANSHHSGPVVARSRA
jgi:predicted XRE-type DNA-binding protein